MFDFLFSIFYLKLQLRLDMILVWEKKIRCEFFLKNKFWDGVRELALGIYLLCVNRISGMPKYNFFLRHELILLIIFYCLYSASN
jgi:hypothetical protein